MTLGSLSTRVFETRTATGSELFSLLTCPDTTTFTLLSIFSPLEMSSINSGRQYRPSTRNVLFLLLSASQKCACLLKLPKTRDTCTVPRGVCFHALLLIFQTLMVKTCYVITTQMHVFYRQHFHFWNWDGLLSCP